MSKIKKKSETCPFQFFKVQCDIFKCLVLSVEKPKDIQINMINKIIKTLLYLFIYIFMSQYILINITANTPELAKRLVFIHSPWPDVKLATLNQYGLWNNL